MCVGWTLSWGGGSSEREIEQCPYNISNILSFLGASNEQVACEIACVDLELCLVG